MKKLLCLMLSFFMLLLFSACSKADDDKPSATPKKTENNASDTVSKIDSNIETTTVEDEPQKESETTAIPTPETTVVPTATPTPETTVVPTATPTPETPVDPPIPSTPIYSQTVTNTFGNLQFTSMTTAKHVAIQGDYIYYSRYHDTDPLERGIFEYNKATKTKRQVSKYPGTFINVVGDYLYYRGALDYYADNWNEPYSVGQLSYKIICVNLKDATYKPVIIDGQGITCYNIVMYKDYVFYNEMSIEKRLCRISSNGTNRVVLADNVDFFYVTDDGKLYYITNSGKSVYSCDIDGSNKLEILKSEKQIYLFAGNGEDLYFANYEKPSSRYVYNIYKVNKNGELINVATWDLIHYYAVVNDRLFICTDDGLFSVLLTNGDIQKFAEADCSFTVYNNKIYIINAEEIFECNLDGTERVKL